ncbi:hypothetical protein BaRGS_00009004 [Batillaria attramentaria]|uniref:Uncharacterized protein n=1 Tax=Batillaria attramentaria TaxID=370345 RepID=A0ABD0LKH0_9CAEN
MSGNFHTLSLKFHSQASGPPMWHYPTILTPPTLKPSHPSPVVENVTPARVSLGQTACPMANPPLKELFTDGNHTSRPVTKRAPLGQALALVT